MAIPAVVSQQPPDGDQANAVVQGTFTASGVSPSFMVTGPFNVVFGGASGPNGTYSATIRLERSFDGGTTWYVCGVGGAGAQAIYSAPNSDVSLVVGEPERGVLYRLNCTAYTSGTIHYRMSTTGGAAQSLAIASDI
jgi:hypothetical protein